MIFLEFLAARTTFKKVGITCCLLTIGGIIIGSRVDYNPDNEVQFCHLWCTSTYALESGARLIFLVYLAKIALYLYRKPNQFMYLTTRLIINK